ncbi:MAG TPA: extracellular solute-binding protein [Candidatus Pullilachnospira intestinigallinarum]|nr:extracellular solute-binding protein [Candidatus Pullilachnospira intestinigallinarum]
MKVRTALAGAIGVVLLVIAALLANLWTERSSVDNGGQEEEEPREITVISSSEVPAHQEALVRIAGEYEESHENVSVVFDFVSRESFREEVCLRVEREEDVDLVICDQMMMPALIDMGLLQEIHVTEEWRNHLAYQKMWASTLSNGRYYGVPLTCDPYVLFYRKDLLEEAGVQVPRTWEELLDTGTGMRQMGRYSMAFPAKRTEEMAEFFLLMLYSSGGNVYSINGEAGLNVMEILSEMWNRGLLPDNTINLSDKDLAGMFSDGNLIMMANRLSMGTVIRDADVSFDVGIAALPSDTAGSLFLMGENIGMARNADPDALGFLNYLCTPEVSRQLADALETYPVYTEYDYEPEETSWCGTESLEPRFQMDNRAMEPYSTWYQISGSISDGMIDLLRTNVDVEDVAVRMQDQVRVAILEE